MNNWKSILFHENTALVIVQDEMHIEFHKIHLAYQAHEMNDTWNAPNKNYCVALIK